MNDADFIHIVWIFVTALAAGLITEQEKVASKTMDAVALRHWITDDLAPRLQDHQAAQ
jgi:hypothetical protein